MKRIIILILVIIYSCESKNNNETFEPVELSEKESFEIVSSLEYKKYMEMRFVFLKRVLFLLNNGYCSDQLTQICIDSVNENKHDVFYETFFGSCDEGENYNAGLIEAKINLLNKFPVLDLMFSEYEGDMPEIEISNFFNNIELNYCDVDQPDMIPQKKGEVVCGSYWNQVKLAACAGLCSFSTAGAGTALCGWACWCMLCTENSSVADVIC